MKFSTVIEEAAMNITYRGILYTLRAEGDVLLFCALVAQLERLAA
jgi:hypothetical protein